MTLSLRPGERLGLAVGLSLEPQLAVIELRGIRNDAPGPIRPDGGREAAGRVTKPEALNFARARTHCESIQSGLRFVGFATGVPTIKKVLQHDGFEIHVLTAKHAANLVATGERVSFSGHQFPLNDISNFVRLLLEGDGGSEHTRLLAPEPPLLANGHDAGRRAALEAAERLALAGELSVGLEPRATERRRVEAVRQELLDRHYQPTAVVTGGKEALEPGWSTKTGMPVWNPDWLNTGLLCTGLVVPDVDVDDPEAAAIAAEVLARHCGSAPIQFRANSPRFAALYRAAEGEPPSRKIKTLAGDIEIRGAAVQLVAFGTHPSSVPYEWREGSPLDTPREDLLPVTAVEIDTLAAELVARLGAVPVPPRPEQLARPGGPRLSGTGDERLRERRRRYLATLVEEEVARVAKALPGGRNHALNLAALRIGHWVPHELDEGEVWSRLEDAACACGLNTDNGGVGGIHRTIRSGLTKGMSEPSDFPPDMQENSERELHFDRTNETVAQLKALAQPTEEKPAPIETPVPTNETPQPANPFDRDALLAEAARDPFSLYRPTTLDALGALERDDPEGFARLLAEIKALRIGTTALRKAITARAKQFQTVVPEGAGGGEVVVPFPGGPPGPPPGAPGGSLSVDDLNAKYCIVCDGGQTRVLYFESQAIGEGRTRDVVTLMSFQDFRNFFLDRKLKVGKKQTSLGSWWLSNSIPGKRKYDGIVFRPDEGPTVNGKLNLWRGFGVKEWPGDWSLMQRHIKEVLASGVAAHATYMTYWLAWTMQNPASRAGVALVLKGKIGTGKGTLGNALVVILGQHGVHISSQEHLSGKFNKHLRDCCFLFADEAFWPGDKSALGALKRLITEPDLFIEGKGKDAFPAPNMLHVLMGSNENWIVPAGENERRYAVFDVSEARMQDEKWFGDIDKQMKNGGYEAMLYDLRRVELGNWHPRQIVKTSALVAQQERTLDFFDEWWVGVLNSGVVPGSTAKAGANQSPPLDDYKVTTQNSYGDERNEKFDGLLSLARKNGGFNAGRMSGKAFSDRLNDVGCYTNGNKISFRGARRRSWRFPDLAEARAKWTERFPNWQWTNPNLADWEPDED